MEYSIDVILQLVLLILHIILAVHAIVLGFVEPLLLLQIAGWLMPAIFILTAIWLIVTGWDVVIQAGVILLSIATNGIGFVLGNIAMFIGTAWAFLAGMGEAALVALQVWVEAKLTLLLGGFESVLMFLGIGLDAGHWLIDGIVSLAGTGLAIVFHGIGTVLLTLGYGFGSIVVILLNVIALAASTLTMLTGAGPTLATLAGGAVALLALPFIVKALLALTAHAIHLISILALRLTFPLWQTSWLFGWVAKMLVACVTLAFYLERSVTHRPSITLDWDGQQWAVAH